MAKQESQTEPKAGAGIDPNRKATPEDAIKLGEVYRALAVAERELSRSTRALNDGLRVLDPDLNYDELRENADKAAVEWSRVRVNGRMIVDRLPRGVTGPGGKATRQTVVMEFYGQVNRDLQNRLTPADARRINRAAWGVPE